MSESNTSRIATQARTHYLGQNNGIPYQDSIKAGLTWTHQL